MASIIFDGPQVLRAFTTYVRMLLAKDLSKQILSNITIYKEFQFEESSFKAYSNVATRLMWSDGNRRLGSIIEPPISRGVGSLRTSARRSDLPENQM